MSKKKVAWISGVALATALGAVAATQVGQVGHDRHQPGATVKGSWVVANGQNAPKSEYRFTVMFSMPRVPNGDGTVRASACTGALISPEWVATAGHCFHDTTAARKRVSGKPRYKTTAAVGQTSISAADGERLKVIDVRQAPGVDFALVRLESPVLNTKPVQLSKAAPRAGRILRLAGWGMSAKAAKHTENLSKRPDQLQTGLVKITKVAASKILVTGKSPAKNTSACSFDSGAPYFSETGGTPRLVATEITGPSCPNPKNETTARVDTLIPWITSVMLDE